MLVIVRELLAFKSSKIQTCSLQDFVNDRKTIFGRGSITNTTVQRNKYIILLYTTFNSLTFIFPSFLFFVTYARYLFTKNPYTENFRSLNERTTWSMLFSLSAEHPEATQQYP